MKSRNVPLNKLIYHTLILALTCYRPQQGHASCVCMLPYAKHSKMTHLFCAVNDTGSSSCACQIPRRFDFLRVQGQSQESPSLHPLSSRPTPTACVRTSKYRRAVRACSVILSPYARCEVLSSGRLQLATRQHAHLTPRSAHPIGDRDGARAGGDRPAASPARGRRIGACASFMHATARIGSIGRLLRPDPGRPASAGCNRWGQAWSSHRSAALPARSPFPGY